MPFAPQKPPGDTPGGARPSPVRGDPIKAATSGKRFRRRIRAFAVHMDGPDALSFAGGAAHNRRMLKTPVVLAASFLAAVSPGRAAHAASDALIGGAFRYFADSATFADCRTGKEIPVAMEGGYRPLEEAYLGQRSAPEAPLYVTVEGRIETRKGMEGPARPTLIVSRFVGAWPGETCERNRVDWPLANTNWKIAILKGETLTPVEGKREASLILHAAPQRSASATVGCNRMAGGFETRGATLTFGRFASTMMACPSPLDQREQALAGVIADTRFYAIAGSTLVLYDAKRAPLAILRAVALR